MTQLVQIKDRQFVRFISEEKIVDAIRRIAAQMEADLKDLQPLFVCVLKGAFMFSSDLLKLLDFPCEITFVRLKSYEGTIAGSRVEEIQGLVEDVENRHVVILEDIIDTGRTVASLLVRMSALKPASVRVAALFFKPDAMVEDVRPDYAAIVIPNDFIVGYGLDYDGWGRNLKHVYRLKET
ncbi:MAG: hypoxanthine phosphoribosyltransferase [Dysgonamonadaceae bacterium]|jgi:hypoxanthine phosphoribosyltransferase|nr:hypoxanthine phosphoribosyltransferase [Dysgonamonadaceae bacterium]